MFWAVRKNTNAVGSLTYSNIGRTLSYRYDGAGNISRVVDSQNGTDEQTDYLYDWLNQLIRVNDSAAGKTTTYTYDAGGNILTKRRYSYTTGSLDGRDYVVVQYTYGNENWKDLLTAYNGNAITYDAIGNPLTYYNGTTFTWDAGRQLSTATKADGTELSFKYNDSGIRTSKTVGGVTTEYFLDGTSVIAEKTGNNILWFYYDGDGSREAVEYNGAVYYYLYNAQGDVLGLFDNNLNVVVNYTYDSWGNLLSVTGDMANTLGQANPFRYRGYYYDTETGLYYLNSRYYDPETGRFINADSIIAGVGGSIQGDNMFAYCFNNPINMSDPSGNLPKWIEDVANWVNDNIIRPIVKFVTDIVEDIKNFDINNQSEEKALESNYFSAYKGVPVVRIGGDRSGSFGAIFLTRETNSRNYSEDVLRHEYGHIKQLQQLGVVNYAIDICIPSALEIGGGDYYSRPWEITADIYGGVQSRHHATDDIEAGFSYLERSKSRRYFAPIFLD